jgi:hypothetical protein
MRLTPKVMAKLFNKLKRQTLSYDLKSLPKSSDRISSAAYCVGYRLNPNRLVFRKMQGGGWSFLSTTPNITFDSREDVSDKFKNCYWNVNITPEIANELLRQKRKHLKSQA